LCQLAAQFLALAEKKQVTIPLMVGHRLVGASLLWTGDVAQSRGHFDQAMTFYDQTQHRPLAMRFGQDIRVSTLCHRSWALWLLGYPNAALVDADDALKDAREIGHAATLMYALFLATVTYIWSGNYATANVNAQELIALAAEKGAPLWKAQGMRLQGQLLALTDKAADAVQTIGSGLSLWRSTGSTSFAPIDMLYLAKSHADLGRYLDASSCIAEAMTAMEATGERWWEPEVHRLAGEIALKSPEPDAAKAEAYFERALAVARQQQAKSWELRAAMSLARLWRSQGKLQQARELLAPVYGWFTEGFDTRDLKEVKALLDELAG
jgi:predicted ATPase